VSITVSPRFFRQFIETVSAELGRDNLPVVMQKADLSPDFAVPENVVKMDGEAAARAYAALQKALRVYYGRGARGVLLRVGHNLWNRLMAQASIGDKVQAQAVRTIPSSLRAKAAMDFAAKFLRGDEGNVSAHTLDRDILISDRNSPTTLNISEDNPVCFVTQGFIEEALYWAMGREFEVSETACRATGQQACEFHITTGGR
jgi:predicted hydrocarbon binding protein